MLALTAFLALACEEIAFAPGPCDQSGVDARVVTFGSGASTWIGPALLLPRDEALVFEVGIADRETFRASVQLTRIDDGATAAYRLDIPDGPEPVAYLFLEEPVGTGVVLAPAADLAEPLNLEVAEPTGDEEPPSWDGTTLSEDDGLCPVVRVRFTGVDDLTPTHAIVRRVGGEWARVVPVASGESLGLSSLEIARFEAPYACHVAASDWDLVVTLVDSAGNRRATALVPSLENQSDVPREAARHESRGCSTSGAGSSWLGGLLAAVRRRR